jgi:hypothetical protein
MRLHQACTLALFWALPIQSFALNSLESRPARPWELTIYRTLSPFVSTNTDSPCTQISLRRSQPHKSLHLPGQDHIIQRRYFTARGERMRHPRVAEYERVRMYTYSEDIKSLWAFTSGICGEERAWTSRVILNEDFPSLAGSKGAQTVLSLKTGTVRVHMEIPSLDVVPLIVSGSSRNRVDLTFFADGCASTECLRLFLYG